MTDRQITISDDAEGARIERAKRKTFGTAGQEIIDQAGALTTLYHSWVQAHQMTLTTEQLPGGARQKWRRERDECAKAISAVVEGFRSLDEKALRYEFERGQRDGLKRFAWWQDGTQYVGSGVYTLERALSECVGEEFRG